MKKRSLNFISVTTLSLSILFGNSLFAEAEKKPPTPNLFAQIATPFTGAPGYYDNTYYPLTYHKIYSKEAFGKEIEIDDGSIWKIRPQDSYIVQEWKSEDYVVISPSSTPSFTGSPYYMTNQRTGTYAYVSLQNGPIIGGQTTTEISYINYRTGDVIVRNGNGIEYFFQLPIADRPFFNDWCVGHAVIVGSNDNWYLTMGMDRNDCILINVERNARHVRATQY